jgi:hypothetical protein
MPRVRSLLVTFVIALAVCIGFAFTIIGLIAEAVAILALIVLALRGVTRVLHHAR